ncbi:DNA topoisomerase 6 subunit B, partial [Trifolium medium]|nr:DNA topoisomerase 6 subunit B [Trifolium medium]
LVTPLTVSLSILAVLSGTKYGLKQTRGKFGLGAKMALIWSKMSTGLPIEISSSMKKQNYITFCRLDIDIHKNIPHVHLHEKRENKQHWHGAEIQVVIEGNWTTYRSKILHYMRQMAVITPYAQFQFKFVSDAPEYQECHCKVFSQNRCNATHSLGDKTSSILC